jgi:hypothetical protein
MISATLIEAIFVVTGKSDTTAGQCPHAMDKWEELIVRPLQKILGLIINTYKHTVGIPDNYVHILVLLNNTWHPGSNPLVP